MSHARHLAALPILTLAWLIMHLAVKVMPPGDPLARAVNAEAELCQYVATLF